MALGPGKEMTGNSGMTSATELFQWATDLNELFHTARKHRAKLESAFMNFKKNIYLFH